MKGSSTNVDQYTLSLVVVRIEGKERTLPEDSAQLNSAALQTTETLCARECALYIGWSRLQRTARRLQSLLVSGSIEYAENGIWVPLHRGDTPMQYILETYTVYAHRKQ